MYYSRSKSKLVSMLNILLALQYLDIIIFPLLPGDIFIIKSIIIFYTIIPLLCFNTKSTPNIGTESTLIFLFQFFASSCFVLQDTFFHLTLFPIFVKLIKYIFIIIMFCFFLLVFEFGVLVISCTFELVCSCPIIGCTAVSWQLIYIFDGD